MELEKLILEFVRKSKESRTAKRSWRRSGWWELGQRCESVVKFCCGLDGVPGPRAQAVRAVDSRLCRPDMGQRWLYKSAGEMDYSAGGAGTTGYPYGVGGGAGMGESLDREQGTTRHKGHVSQGSKLVHPTITAVRMPDHPKTAQRKWAQRSQLKTLAAHITNEGWGSRVKNS